MMLSHTFLSDISWQSIVNLPSTSSFLGAQTRWNACQGNKLHAILPQVRSKITMNVNTRRDQTVIHRCLIGHSQLTHLHLLNNDPAPICRKCRQPLTITHILIECQNTLHRRLYQAESLKQLFSKVPTNTIIQFLHKNKYYCDIWIHTNTCSLIIFSL